MASRESQGSKKDEDPYNIDYYDRNEAGIQRQKIEDIQREIGNVEVKLNNMSKHSLIRFICLLVLGLAILVLLFVSRGGGEAAGASSEPPPSLTPATTGAPSTATAANGRYKL